MYKHICKQNPERELFLVFVRVPLVEVNPVGIGYPYPRVIACG